MHPVFHRLEVLNKVSLELTDSLRVRENVLVPVVYLAVVPRRGPIQRRTARWILTIDSTMPRRGLEGFNDSTVWLSSSKNELTIADIGFQDFECTPGGRPDAIHVQISIRIDDS
jgi:hypothetical protein